MLLVQFRVKVLKHWIGSISFQFFVTDGHTEQIYKGRSTLSILDTKSECFVFLHQTVLTQHKKNLRSRVFPGRGDWQEPHLFPGWPHFERLNSLSFPRYFQIFPEQLKRENLLRKFLFAITPHTLHFPSVFQVLLQKLRFP